MSVFRYEPGVVLVADHTPLTEKELSVLRKLKQISRLEDGTYGMVWCTALRTTPTEMMKLYLKGVVDGYGGAWGITRIGLKGIEEHEQADRSES